MSAGFLSRSHDLNGAQGAHMCFCTVGVVVQLFLLSSPASWAIMVAGDTSAIGAPGAIQAIDGCSPNDPSQSASHANAPAECTFLQNQAGKHQQPTEATAPSSAAIDIPLPVIKFTEPVPTRDQIQGKAVEYEIRTFGSEELTFQEWMAASSDAEVRGYFRALCTELDTVMKLEDYHLKLCNRFDHAERRTLPGWEVRGHKTSDPA